MMYWHEKHVKKLLLHCYLEEALVETIVKAATPWQRCLHWTLLLHCIQSYPIPFSVFKMLHQPRVPLRFDLRRLLAASVGDFLRIARGVVRE
jgi:hypothetical protein